MTGAQGWRWSAGGVALLLAALVQLACLAPVWRRRHATAATGLAAVLLATLVWDVAHGLELLSADQSGRVRWGAVKYAGIAALPPAWLAFSLQYTGRKVSGPLVAGLSVLPGCVLVLLAHPGSRELVRFYDHAGSEEAAVGPVFWPFVGYTTGVLVYGLALFARGVWRVSPAYRRPIRYLAGFALLPCGAILSYNLDLDLYPGVVDPTPLVFSLAGPLLLWGVFTSHLLPLRPIARSRVLELLEDAVLVLDPYGRVVDVTRAGERLLEVPGSASTGRPLAELLPGWDTARLRQAADADGVTVVERTGIVHEVRVRSLPDRAGRWTGWLLVARDVTARLRAEERFRVGFEQALVGMALVGSDGRLLQVNRALGELSGHPPAALVGRELLALSHPEEWRADQAGISALVSGEATGWRRETRLVRADGTVIEALVGVAAVRGPAGPDYLIAQVEDITERKVAEQALLQQALHDPLTDLANRVLLHDRLQQALDLTARRPQPVGVLLIDLDRFKTVNDTLGHSAGDQLLRLVALRLVDVLRPQDTVARLGGDEFAVVLPQLEATEGASVVADRVRTAITGSYRLDHGEVTVQASIGIAVAGPGDDPDRLLRDADAAMYLAKQRGGAAVQQFDPSLRAALVDRLRVERELHHAVAGGELRVAYQLVFALPSRTPVAVEALVRWQHPTRGELLPESFLRVAEESGLVVPLGSWVLGRALAEAARLPGLVVAVNVSPRQLRSPELARSVLTALAAAECDPARLCLEVTEDGLLETIDTAAGQLRTLRRDGVRIALDDFGTGGSSLSHVRHLPVDLLKIDRSFTRNVVGQAADRTIVELVIDLAHALDLTAVAEGVETVEQLELLGELGCDQVQGFLLARPQSADALAEPRTGSAPVPGAGRL